MAISWKSVATQISFFIISLLLYAIVESNVYPFFNVRVNYTEILMLILLSVVGSILNQFSYYSEDKELAKEFIMAIVMVIMSIVASYF